MESRFYQSKSSLFTLLKNSKINDLTNLNRKAITNTIQKSRPEYLNLRDKLANLHIKVMKKDQHIDDIVKSIELSLESRTNDKSLIISLYSSKLFLEIIDAFNISLPEYQEKLLVLIEKILQNKKMGKYLSKNQKILPKILKYIVKTKNLETYIKISESLLMNSQSLYPLNSIGTEITDIYNFMVKKDKLDTLCRILAIMIFDYKKMEYCQMFKSKEILRIKPLTKRTAENQSICFHFNNFFQNIIKKLQSRIEKTKKITTDTSLSRNIINYISSTDANIDINEENDNEIITISAPSSVHSESANHSQKNNEEKQAIDTIELININTKKVAFSQKEFLSMIYVNIFMNFNPDFTFSSVPPNQNNIYNTYRQITNCLSTIKNKNKIHPQIKYYITIYKYSTYQIEMLFVLSTLLGSKRKIEIQDKLRSLNIIEILDGYLEYMEWGNIFGNSKRPFFSAQPINTQDETAYHGEGCCCDSDTALKIQYLRLIYTFCSRDDNNVKNKLKMFSKKELQTFMDKGYLKLVTMCLREKYQIYSNCNYTKFNKDFENLFQKINENPDAALPTYESIENILVNFISIKSFSDKIDSYNYKDEDVGLLQKLIYKYMRECYYSSCKFWLSSCIEVVLRGNNTFFQTYIACSGLIPCLLYDILYSNKDQSQIIQLSFDILGELIKFNRANFYILSYYLADSKEMNEFMSKILAKDSLVDSNVLLRSIILSNYFFDKNDEACERSPDNYFSFKCKLCKLVKGKLGNIFISLISIISPDSVNQMNISCINSALLILTLEYMKGTLGDFLNVLRNNQTKEVIEGIENFKNLLIMWQKFYNFRPKDAASLQHSTTISFNILQQVAMNLLSKDPNNIMSLYNFIK